MTGKNSAITKIQAIIIAVIIVVAAVAGVAYYLSLPGAAPQKTKIVFGASLSVTGAEIAGPRSYEAGVRVALDEINAGGGIYVPEIGKSCQ